MSTESDIVFPDENPVHPYDLRRVGRRVVLELDLDRMEYDPTPGRCDCGQRLRAGEGVCWDCCQEAIRQGRKIRQQDDVAV